MKKKTIFEQIRDHEIPAEIVFENNEIFAIKDIHPQAPVHLLIITKKVIPSLQEMDPEDFYLLEGIVVAAKKLAKEFKIDQGYRLLTNVGSDAGQTIHHLHFHLLGGKSLGHLG